MAVDTTGTSISKPQKSFAAAERLVWPTCMVVFRRPADINILPFVHVILGFIFHLTQFANAIALIEDEFPWELLSVLLNSLLQSYREHDQIHSVAFPREAKEVAPRPLPEDFAMKGMLWVENYFPHDWFSNNKIDDDEKYFETASMIENRKERILWLGCRIAAHGKWLIYDDKLHQFQPAVKYRDKSDDIDMMNAPDADDSISGVATVGSGQASVKTERGDEDTMDVDIDNSGGPGKHYTRK